MKHFYGFLRKFESRQSYLGVNYFGHPERVQKDEVCEGFTKGEFEMRRKRILHVMENGSVLSSQSSPIKLMTSGIPYPYRQNSNFYYLTGNSEPMCGLFMKKTNLGEEAECMIVLDEPADLLLCNPLGVEKSKEVFGISDVQAYPGDAFVLPEDGIELLYSEDRIEEYNHRSLPSILSEFRKIKSSAEVEMLKKVATITEECFLSVLNFLRPGINEKEIENFLEYEMKRRGATRFSFIPVIAGGNRANMIHYILNNQIIDDGELVMIDAGAEYNMYVSDVTRTFPVNGTFTKEQKIIYQIVLDANKQCIESVLDGTATKTEDLDAISALVIASELIEQGVCRDITVNDLVNQMDRFLPHSVSHFMGIDVHEVCSTGFVQNCVFTVEPGIYIDEHKDYSDLGLDERFLGISVRIEDDIVYKEDESIILSEGIPKEIAEIEEIMKREE